MRANGKSRVSKTGISKRLDKSSGSPSPRNPRSDSSSDMSDTPVGRKTDSETSSQADGPGIKLPNQWQKYYSYQQLVVRLDKVLETADDKRQSMVQWLVERNASCFWIALAMTTKVEVVKRLIKDRNIKKPITIEQAIQMNKNEFNLYWHNVSSGRAEEIRSVDTKRPLGVFQVMFDDSGKIEPHWLPIYRIKRENFSWKPSKENMKDLEKYMAELKKPVKAVEAKAKSPANLYEVLSDSSSDGDSSDDESEIEVATSSHVVADKQLALEIAKGFEELEAMSPVEAAFRARKLQGAAKGPEKEEKAEAEDKPAKKKDKKKRSKKDDKEVVEGKKDVGVGPDRGRPPPRPPQRIPLVESIPYCSIGYGETPPPNWHTWKKPLWIGGNTDEAAPWALSIGELPAFPWMKVMSAVSGAAVGWVYGQLMGKLAQQIERKVYSILYPKTKTQMLKQAATELFEHVVTRIGETRDAPGVMLSRGVVNKFWFLSTAGGICGLSAVVMTTCRFLWNKWKQAERHIFESRKTVLKGAFVCAGDYLYERCREQHGTNDLLNTERLLKLTEIEELDCGAFKFSLGPVRRLGGPGGRIYNVAQIRLGLNCETIQQRVRRWLRYPERHEVLKIGIKPQEEIRITVDSLSELPTEEAKVRALYTMMKPLLPEECVGIVNDIRNAHLAEGPDASEVQKVVKQTVQMSETIKSQLFRVPAFGHSTTRCPKSCVSCGCEPPEKYRWKHRICSNCTVALNKLGYTTWSGYQVQNNLHVPTCYPGIVKVRGEQKAPKASKWRLVPDDVRVKVCWNQTKCTKLTKMDKGFKWDTFQKQDLEKLKRPEEARFTHALIGIACSGARPMVSANTQYNCAKALLGRVFLGLAPKPWDPAGGPKPGIWEFAYSLKDEILPNLETVPMDFEEWLDSMPSRRKPALRKGKINLDRTGWIKLYEAFNSFLKTELLPGFDKENGDLTELIEMLDRLINGPSEESHCVAGRYLKPKIKKLKQMWHSESHLFYGSAGPEALHRFLQRLISEDRQFFWCDFSMYDRTHSNMTWDFMEKFYSEIDDPSFWAVMKAWRAPKGKIGAFKFVADVMNASGRDDTALVNAVLNGFATYLSACAAWLGKDVETLTAKDVAYCKTQILLSVCGDDSLGGLPMCSEVKMADFRLRFNESISKFGFVAKLCTSSVIEDAVYLGMRPYPTKSGIFWGKTIGRSTYKMGWAIDKGQDLMAHITGIADMHILCSSHVPILSDLAQKIFELRQGARRTPVHLDPNKPWEWTFKSGVQYDDVTLASVARAYSTQSTPGNPKSYTRDVTVQDVRGLITEIRAIKRLPCVLDHWLWKHMIYADDL